MQPDSEKDLEVVEQEAAKVLEPLGEPALLRVEARGRVNVGQFAKPGELWLAYELPGGTVVLRRAEVRAVTPAVTLEQLAQLDAA